MQLEIRNLAKLYDQKRGLTPTSFEVTKGELIAIAVITALANPHF